MRTVLGLEPDIQLIGEAATMAAAVAEAARLKPDVVLMDIRLPDGTGVEACRRILSARPATRVLFLTSFGDEDTVLAAICSGAHGYVLKDIASEVLIEAIRKVAAGQSLLDPEVTSQALQWVRSLSGTVPRSKVELLSAQEQRILPLIAEGKTNKEIAVAMQLSDKTVKNYIANLYQKLHITRRAEAAALFARTKPQTAFGADSG